MARPDTAGEGTEPDSIPPRAVQRCTFTHALEYLGSDRLMNGLALAGAGIALLVTGFITLTAATGGQRLADLAANSEANTHGQLMRIERTLRRMARGDSWARYERKVTYPGYFVAGRDLVERAKEQEKQRQLDSAIKLSTTAVLVYNQALAMVDSTTEEWALGTQLRDWAEYNISRVVQKDATVKSYRIQRVTAWAAIILGALLLTVVTLTMAAFGKRASHRPPAVADTGDVAA